MNQAISQRALGPEYWDDEIDGMHRILNRGGWMPHEVAFIVRQIRDRAEYVTAGLVHPTAQYWTRRIQQEIDNRTRVRWDFKNGWTFERWAEGRWQTVGVYGLQCLPFNLIQWLAERDMQRYENPMKYIEYKRMMARRKAEENWRKSNQKLGAIIDAMSDKQIREFITVEKAMQTGETITMHGATERAFRHMEKASKGAPDIPHNQAINPGHHFKVLTRKRGGKHRLA